MILIYSPELSERLKYTCNIIFKTVLRTEFKLSNESGELDAYNGPKINYSFERNQDEFFIEASGLLYERNISDQSEVLFPKKEWKDLPVFFPSKKDSSLPFDIFSAVFYFVSRYEEYLPFACDEHRRFRHTESLAFHYNLVERPIVNLWILAFADLLIETFGESFSFKKQEFSFIPTIDIDNASAYKHKGVFRTFGSLLRSVFSNQLKERLKVLRGAKPDPYEVYDYLEEIHAKHEMEPTMFFLLGKYGKFDKNLHPSNRYYRKIIQYFSTRHKTGIHPSYTSNMSFQALQKEINCLKEITARNISISRQHYLMISFPETYTKLGTLGIEEDYSLGFHSHTGFRGGICTAYPFFNIETNKETNLLLIPFQIMDVSLKQYMKLSPEASKEKITQLLREVSKVGGCFVSLWHNESLSENVQWKGWREVYEHMLLEASELIQKND